VLARRVLDAGVLAETEHADLARTVARRERVAP
jgi:hypothetical protein